MSEDTTSHHSTSTEHSALSNGTQHSALSEEEETNFLDFLIVLAWRKRLVLGLPPGTATFVVLRPEAKELS